MHFPSPYPALDIPDTDVFSLIFAGLSLADAPLPALTDDTGTVTYGELKHRAEAFAAGIRPGDVVTLQLPNSIDFTVALLGILRAGATVNPLGMLVHPDEAAVMKRACRSAAHVTAGNVESVTGTRLPPLPSPGQLAALPFSSGTTGLPKGVKLTHRNLVANILQTDFMLRRNGAGRGTTTASVLPFAHIYGMTVQLLAPLYARHHVITMGSFSLERFAAAHRDHGVRLAFIAPPIAVALAKHPDIDPADFASSELMISGAAPLDAGVVRTVGQRLGTEVIQGWGMTEASPFVSMNVRGGDPGSVGKPAPNTEVRLNENGEILVRGPQVMSGYLGAAPVEGWLRTGDIAEIADDGSIRIVDRAKEIIKYKGYQVAPAELEALLLTHPGVADAGVVGVERGGLEVPQAFVVKQGPVSADELMAWVAERVTPYKKIRAVTFVGEIPRNASGKILRRELRAESNTCYT